MAQEHVQVGILEESEPLTGFPQQFVAIRVEGADLQSGLRHL